ncbi:hypothetical protein [Arthrobacter sp. U41]|uniref:hypothetical protein n=1 Tax=Arthrobacter sp. U41 TaxID=1849032 RepID=UPI00085952C8|nr:hypothetical protein [Arthrobacter sp. U41]AOT04940.1 hypothetical protein ASPU41_18080 [Arthrobacter sp. U41]
MAGIASTPGEVLAEITRERGKRPAVDHNGRVLTVAPAEYTAGPNGWPVKVEPTPPAAVPPVPASTEPAD